MTDSSRPSRPQQVTTAVVLSVAACVLAVVNLFTTRDELRGTSVRDAITEAQRGVAGLATDEQVVVRVLEALVLVSGALAASAAVLAVFAWQRHRGAWIGFFVVAALLALTLPVAGVLPVLLLASGATFMGSRPVRDWFADRAPAAVRPHVLWAQEGPQGPSGPRPEPPPYPGRFGAGGSSAVPPGPPPGSSQESPATAPTGPSDPSPAYGPWHGATDQDKTPTRPPWPPTTPPPGGGPVSGQGPGQEWGHGPGQEWGQGWGPGAGAARDPDKRPGTVTAACVITWVGATLVALLTGLLALVLAADQGAFVREFQRQADVAEVQVSAEQLTAIAWTTAGIGLVWCLVAILLAVLAFRRSRGGRIGLAVSAALTVLVSLLLVLSVVAVVPLLLGIAVLVLLFTGGANPWYARRPGSPGGGAHGGSPYGGPQYGGPQYGGPQYGEQQPPPPPGRSGPW